jgi:hypothetical protein
MSSPINMRGHGSIYSQAAAGSTTQSDNAKVIPGSQSYAYVIPIINLPGRNGLDLNLSLYYNSRVWTITTASPKTITFNVDRDFPSYGFRLGFGFLESGTNLYTLIEGDGTKRSLVKPNPHLNSDYTSTDSSFVVFKRPRTRSTTKTARA